MARAAGNVFRIPDPLVEHAMQVIVAVILWQRVGRAVECELSMRDSVGVTSDDGTEVGFAGLVVFQFVVAEYYVFELAIAVRNLQRDDRASVVGDRGFHAVLISQSKKIGLLSVFGFAK